MLFQLTIPVAPAIQFWDVSGGLTDQHRFGKESPPHGLFQEEILLWAPPPFFLDEAQVNTVFLE